jgi:hypothetical protein
MIGQDQQTREQMVEKAARASHQYGFDCGGVYADWDDLSGTVQQQYRADAAAVLDAVLPQVSTVEELEALPAGAKVLDTAGDVYWKLSTGRFRDLRGNDDGAEHVTFFAPLTVVWTPPTT